MNEEDLFDRTALYLAARADADPQVLEVLLAAGAKVEARCDRGFKPLHWAVKNGNRRNVKLLLAHKADVNAPDANRQTPLHYVATNGDLEMAKFLLDNGASYNMKDNSGARPIRCAIRNGHRDIVELLQRVREERLKRDKK